MPHNIVNFAMKWVRQAWAVEPFGFNNTLPYLLSPDFSTNCARIYRLLTVSELLQSNTSLGWMQRRNDVFHMAGESPQQAGAGATSAGGSRCRGHHFLQGKKKKPWEDFFRVFKSYFFLQEMCQSPALPVTLRGAGAACHWVCRPCLPACCPQQSIVSPQTLFGAVNGADGIAQGLEATISLSSFLHCQRLLQRQTSSCEMQL